jgi:hypothetical protein
MSSSRQRFLRNLKVSPRMFRLGLALMMFHNLGRLLLEADAIEHAREATAGGDKHEPTFRVDVVDAAGDVVAVVDKTLHIRRQGL